MTTAYQAPGAYHQRFDAGAPKIVAIRTDVAGFVGIAERGPLNTAVVVESWRQYQAHFGGFTPAGYLAYTVHAFFLNGGRRCWVVRVADPDAAGVSSVTVEAPDPALGAKTTAWRIEASSPGGWGDQLTVELMEVRRAQTRIERFEDGQPESTVTSTSGFARRSFARIRQAGGFEQYKVVSQVNQRSRGDPRRGGRTTGRIPRRLIWVSDDDALRLRTDGPLRGPSPTEPVFVEALDYRLVVRSAGRVIGTYDGLSRVPGHPRYAPDVLESVYDRARTKEPHAVPSIPPPVVIVDLRRDELERLVPTPLRVGAAPRALTGGFDGLSTLRVEHFVGEMVLPDDDPIARARKERGLEVLRTNEEIAAVAVPDIHIRPDPVAATARREPCRPDPCLLEPPPSPPEFPTPPTRDLPPVFSLDDVYRVQDAMVQQAEETMSRVALLDAPAEYARSTEEGFAGIIAWRGRFESKYAALYYPWLKVPNPIGGRASLTRDLPPCGHVAGRYAGTDYEVGVHKAPANVPLEWVQDLTAEVDLTRAGILNPEGINAIRSFAGRGIRIYGARMTSSDPTWRFVNVRRLVLMIRKALEFSTQWAAFEPNDAFTRAKVRLALLSFLTALWQQGALVGDGPDEAFFVKCDEENNPAFERDNGKLVADVGIAPSNPFEFVVMRIGRTESAVEFSDVTQGVF